MKGLSYSKERTFYLSQFEEGKVYDVPIAFEGSEGQVSKVELKVQYVKDEEGLIESILELYESKRKLLSLLLKKWIDEINGDNESIDSDKGDNPQDENSYASDDLKMNLLNKIRQHSMISWGQSNKTHSFAGKNWWTQYI